MNGAALRTEQQIAVLEESVREYEQVLETEKAKWSSWGDRIAAILSVIIGALLGMLGAFVMWKVLR